MTHNRLEVLPRISVVVPAYKQEHFLKRCLDSIQVQSYEGEVEVIVVDDGSPDESAKVARKHPINALVIQKENGGVSSARNEGIRHATGDYIAFLDADDYWHKDKLRDHMNTILEEAPVSLSFTRYHRVNGEGELFQEHGVHPAPKLTLTTASLIRQNFVGTSTVIAHRQCFEQCGDFPANKDLLKAGQDYALWLKISLDFPLVYHDEVKTYYTVHKSNRVGINPLKHHAGGIYALRALWKWDEKKASAAVSNVPLKAIILWRSVKLCKDLVKRRKQVPMQVWKDLIPTLTEFLID